MLFQFLGVESLIASFYFPLISPGAGPALKSVSVRFVTGRAYRYIQDLKVQGVTGGWSPAEGVHIAVLGPVAHGGRCHAEDNYRW